ncbi:MAG: transglycosylase SLT domain-containing protein [candidate division Zixibacteria bacterium]|nr:transglycosylase SLT domain-containing protein [candidate division Zixibacteria bacterium]
MTHVNLKAAAVFPQSGIERLKGQQVRSPEARKARLRKVSKEFESFFTYYMLKAMRKTVPEGSLTDQAPFSGKAGKDIFTDLFDMELSRKMPSGNSNSIADILYRSMEKLVTAQSSASEIEIQPLRQQSESVPLPRDLFNGVSRPVRSYDIPAGGKRPMPLEGSSRAAGAGSIVAKYGKYINEAAARTSLDPALILSVIKAESNGDPRVVSRAGAKGLMQLVDSTAADYRVERVFDPRENIMAGSKYLRDLIDRFGDLRLALAAYNAGPTNVTRYQGIPPFNETRNYVDKVMTTMRALQTRTAVSSGMR